MGDIMTVLITGAASGMGYEVGMRLVKDGYYVFFATHREEEARRLQEKCKKFHKVKVMKLDITSKKDIRQLLPMKIDIVICNAAIGMAGSLPYSSVSDLKRIFETNFFATVKFIKFMISKMQKDGGGKVIVTSSMVAHMRVPYLSFYGSSKAALSYLCWTLRQELMLTNSPVQITVMEPGIFNTGFNDWMIDYADFLPNQSFLQLEKKLFRLFGKNSYRSIVRKYQKACSDKKLKRVYRAPLSTTILLHVYAFLFE